MRDKEFGGFEPTQKTSWRNLALATTIGFLSSLEMSMVSMGEFPYMTKMDPKTTTTFFGMVNSVVRAGHAISLLVFAWWSHRRHVTKLPLIVGRCISLVGCLMYISLEYVPSNRRYYMLACYILFGIGHSTSPLLRSYVARVSSEDQRTSAYALFNTASIVSHIIGPLTQLAFSFIPYPGVQILPKLDFHIYSAPIWIALITNCVTLWVIGFFFDDPPPAVVPLSKEPPEKKHDYHSLARWKQRFNELKNSPIAWTLVFLVLFEKSITHLTISTLQAIGSPMMMAVFGFDGPLTVKVSAIAQVTIGSIGLFVSALFVFCKLGMRLSPRLLYAFSLFIKVVFFMATYPYDFVGQPMKSFNATTRTGCNPMEYRWCNTAKSPSPYLWFPILILVGGLAAPTGHISLDAIYSKVLGKIDQSLMQGAIVFVEDVLLVTAPIYATEVFTAFGLGPLWIVNGYMISFGFAVWIIFWKQLKNYSSKEKI